MTSPAYATSDAPTWLGQKLHHLGRSGMTFCGATGMRPSSLCPRYKGEALCPRCGTPTCPRCAQISALDSSFGSVIA